MSRIAVFGYASLVSRPSAAATLGRPVEIAELVRLRGWARRWTLARDNATSEKTFVRPDGSLPRFCLSLNAEADERGTLGDGPNGALIEVSPPELERLDLREIRYRRVEVAAAIETIDGGPPSFDEVYVYTSLEQHHRPIPPDDAIIVGTYSNAVEAAFAALGADQLRLYRETTDRTPVPVVAARLVRDRIPPGNPRDW